MEATVNTTDKTAIDLHSTRIIRRHIFLHTLYCMNQRYNWQVTDLKTVFQLYSFKMLFSPSVFYFTDDTPCVSKALIKLYQITDNGCFATRYPKHKPKTEITPPPKKKHCQKSRQQQHGGCGCDASFTFTTRPPQNICKCDAVTPNSRAVEPQPSMKTSAYQDIKRTNTSVAPSQKKKNNPTVANLWLNESIQKPSHLSPQEKVKYVARKMLHSSHVGLFQQLCNTTLFLLENLLCTKHTHSIKAHLMQIVTTDQRPRSPLYDSSMVIVFYRLQMNASSPNWKLAYHGHFFPFLWHPLFPWDLNAAFDAMFSCSILWNAHL